jgi:hypothetical protein
MELLKSALLARRVHEGCSNDVHFNDQRKRPINHRAIITYETEAKAKATEIIVQNIVNELPVP